MPKKSPSKKPQNPIIIMLRAEWQNLGQNKKRYILYMALFVIAALFRLILPWIIGEIFNTIQAGEITTVDQLHHLFFLFSLIFLTELILRIIHWTARIIERLTAFQTHKNYTNSKVKKVVELPVSWHKDNHSGDTIDRINKARTALYFFAQHDTFQLVYILVNILGSLAMIFFIDAQIGTFALSSCLLILWAIMALDKPIKTAYKNKNKYEHKLSATIFDYFSNIITVITLRLKPTVKSKIDERVQASYNDHKKEVYLSTTKWQIGSLAVTLMTVLALIYRTHTDFYTTGTILIGTLYMLYSYLDRVGNYFFRFAEFYGSMTKKAADMESVDPIDQAYGKIQNKINRHPPKNWNNIQIKNLNFSYNSDDINLHMKNINLSFKHGEKIALIGESGSGKSTILSLLRGLYQPTSAEILVDNKPLKNGIETLKRTVTLIPQDPEIFNETIRYNITMDMFQNQNQIDKAIQMAQFKTVVQKLPKKLETNVQEKGVSLSGGEKQRLALARGLLAAKDSDIILLDEPTSSVDSTNERKIHENIFKEFKDKTIISSIHRLHLLDKFDKIIIFDQGKIVASGTYKQIQQNPIFKKIWQRYIGSKEE